MHIGRFLPHCDCGKCTCNINGRINNREDKLKIRKFLIGLNDQFRQVRSHILSLDALPKLNKVYSMVTHEESKALLNNPHAQHAHVFYSSKVPTAPQSAHAGKTVNPSNQT